MIKGDWFFVFVYSGVIGAIFLIFYVWVYIIPHALPP
jgi:hypothetical protein